MKDFYQQKTIFEYSSPGRSGVDFFEETDNGSIDQDDKYSKYDTHWDPAWMRDSQVDGLPEVAETDVMRHYTRLSSWNFFVDQNFYPLGSCTMKHNPRINEKIASDQNFLLTHPYQPEEELQGVLQVLWETQEWLKNLSGMDAVCLQPAAGAQGELTALLVFKAYFRAKGEADNRKIILIPESAHGTNPASAALAGFEVRSFATGEDGFIDISLFNKKIEEMGSANIAGVMVTNPNTLGFFEPQIVALSEILHQAGALLYVDGANFNAILRKTDFGKMGADAIHFNLHKTFATPHGGGGPGAGPVGVSKELVPFLPGPMAALGDDSIFYSMMPPKSIGRVKAFWGNFGVVLRALAYIRSMGNQGLEQVAEAAVLNANFIKQRLSPYLQQAYTGNNLHEVIFSDKGLKSKYGITTLDLAKALLDRGFHAPTVYFPLIVSGAMMIEPTETESWETLEVFCDAVIDILKTAQANPADILSAPLKQKVKRLDEVQAARKPILVFDDQGK